MNRCPKCLGYFLHSYVWCDKHQAEYDIWINKKYNADESCENGHTDWIHGTLQMTEPASYPEKDVYRCRVCDSIRLERSEDGTVRIADYEGE